MKSITKIWLWLAVLFTVAGAILLYPISKDIMAANILFLLIKAGMLIGLFVLLFSKRRWGLMLWVISSAEAVAATAVKWQLTGTLSFQSYALFITSMIVDILMPLVAFCLLHKEKTEGRT